MIVISSFNREVYDGMATFTAFKESGDIEYTADVVWRLQLSVRNEPLFYRSSKAGRKGKKSSVKRRGKSKYLSIRRVEMFKKSCLGMEWVDKFKCYPDKDYFVED